MIPKWVIEQLDRHGTHYEHLHRPEGFTPDDLETDEHGCRVGAAEVSVAVADGRLLELVYPANDWVDLDKVSELVSCSELRLATEAELRDYYPDCEPGAVPPLRHPANSDVIVDPWVDINSTIVFLAGCNRDAIRMPMQDWIQMVNPRTASISQPVESPVVARSAACA